MELLSGQRHENETNKAVIACNDYLRLGPGRSLANLLDRYQSGTESAPTNRLTTLKDWSRKFGWQARATAYDANWEERKNAERILEMGYGLALDYERVRKLKRLANFLEEQIYETAEEQVEIITPSTDEGDEIKTQTATIRRHFNVWVRDVKGIGKGDDFERVQIERFNTPLIAEYRAVLDDLAKETGGRVKKQDVTSGGEKIEVVVVYADD